MPAAMTAEAGMAAIVAAAIVAAAADSGNGDHRDRDRGDRDNGRGGPMIPPGGMVTAEESATVGPSGTSAV